MVPTTTPNQPITSAGKGVNRSINVTRQTVTIPPSNNLYTRPGPKKCFKCNQQGHRSHQCPRRQMVNLIEAETSEAEESEWSDRG